MADRQLGLDQRGYGISTVNVQLNLQEITEAFGAIYNSIDLRTVAVQQGGSWVNILTVVRVAQEPPAQIDKRHAELKSLHVLPELADVRIMLSSKPFSEWEVLRDDLKNSILRSHPGAEVKLTGSLDIYSKYGNVARHHNVLRAVQDWDWPTCEISFAHNPAKWEQLGLGDRLSLLSARKLSQQISQFGHSNVFDAIDAFMEFSMSFVQNPGLEFYVSVPIFAAIDSVEVKPDGNLLRVRGRFHARMANVQFFAVCRDSPSSTGLLPKATLPLDAQDVHGSKNAEVREVLATAVLPASVTLSDFVEVKAVTTLGDVDAVQAQVRSLLPLQHVQPLYHALTWFRSPTELREALASPHTGRKAKPRSWDLQRLFERDVCWFLSCFGFATVMLSEFESLKGPDSKFERGSLDILAYSESRKLMLIVGCTLNAPKDSDFTNISTLRTIFLDEILPGSNTSLIPVIFSGLKSCQSYWEQTFADYGTTFCTVPILDGSRREAALQLLESKQEQAFYDFLSHPSTGQLG
jgi:hypothetical protein